MKTSRTLRVFAVALVAWAFAPFVFAQSLAEKAAVFERDLQSRFDLQGQILCKLMLPAGDRDFIAYNMPDNAYMTGIVLGARSMKYAVTGDASDRALARTSLKALHLLCTVSGRPGLLARAAWPVDTPMADDGIWRESADGDYRWRGDVSSDQVDGVLYGFYWAYELIADTEEKAAIARDVAALVDHLLENDLRIIGFDGEPTQWGSYYPEYVRTQEPMNALLFLQHLKIAVHVTGEARFTEAYRRYAFDEGYLELTKRARRAADPMRRGAVNHSDDVLRYLAYSPLFELERDPEIVPVLKESLTTAWEGDGTYPGVGPEHNPLFAFITRRALGDDISIRESVTTLERFPFDMKWNSDTFAHYAAEYGINWDPTPVSEPVERGTAVPIDRREKSWSAWVMNPYTSAGTRTADAGTEYNGHDYLAAYWMGRYFGYIGEDE